MKKIILIGYGTRPEIIKFSPLIKELARQRIPFKTVFTGQHFDLYKDVANLVPKPDFCCEIAGKNQSLAQTSQRIFETLPAIIKKVDPAVFIVQGDTISALMGAIAAFYEGVAVGHVEAGIRTYDLEQPFPEEAHRQMVSRIARFNWAPTKAAVINLKKENIKNVSLTGNTIVDICKSFKFKCHYGQDVLITLHRRENFGQPLKSMFLQLEELAATHKDLRFIFPMHPNPNVQALRPLLRHVHVIKPLSYEKLLAHLAKARCVITDSGGIQEECATFKKKVLVCRLKTEREEGIKAGFARLVGHNILKNFSWAADQPNWSGSNPYGDGRASERIVASLVRYLKTF